MSAQAMGWVFSHSPLTGAAFALHLAIADSVNDMHDNMFFMRQQRLAAKARCSRATVAATIRRMLDLGLLVRVDDPPGENRRRSRHEPVRFRFVMPATVGCQIRVGESDVQNLDIGLDAAETPEAEPVTFEQFWQVYPRKLDRKAARRRWVAAVKAGAVPAEIVAGAERYRDWPGRVPRYTKYPATWLGAGAWDNQLDPTATPTGGRTAGNEAVLAEAVEKMKARERTVAASETAWTSEAVEVDEGVIG